ncbi:MAG: hypothetical protein ABW098_04825 [Candidatus Thiodiazotropha sp.]
MSQELLVEHQDLVVEIANIYLDNMEIALGKKYKNNSHQIDASLSNDQYTALSKKHNISVQDFAELYNLFQGMKPSKHLKQTMDAFTASGGTVDIEPHYDDSNQKLHVAINFIIKDKTFDKLEGLSPLEDIMLRMNAMLQIDTVLSGSDPDIPHTF